MSLTIYELCDGSNVLLSLLKGAARRFVFENVELSPHYDALYSRLTMLRQGF